MCMQKFTYWNFNPRSREGSDYTLSDRPCQNYYFNPRSREGSDVQPFAPIVRVGISIHAPVKGATPGKSGPGPCDAISIHAPVKGATCRWPAGPPGRQHFNPRSREGSDPRALPTWLRPMNFNPRSREGSDF